MDNKKLIEEIERLRTLSASERLIPSSFDSLMKMAGGTTWAQEIGEE